MNIFLRELNANKKALIIWSICMILFVMMGMQKYEALIGSTGDMTEINKLIGSMPKVIQTMWGISEVDLSKPIGYFSVLVPFIFMMGGIYASMLGANLIAKEERDKTVEFLITKPVSRFKIMTAKILAGKVNLIIFNLATMVTSYFVLSNLSKEAVFIPVLLSAISLFFIELLFMIIGVGMASMSRNYKKSGSMTIFILLATYFISVIIDMTDKLDILKIFTPFKYFDAKKFLVSNSLDMRYILLTLAIMIVILVPSYITYRKRDLNF